MKFIKTDIQDVIIVEPAVFGDSRGAFFECYNQHDFYSAGITSVFVQDNQSESVQGVIRGLHYQKGEHCQAKLVRVLFGEVLDVAVDLRQSSPTYGKHISVVLSEENKRMLFIPRGFAHGFSVLSERAVFTYKCDNLYCKASEGGIRFDDPDLAIDWKINPNNAITSEKDRVLPSFKEYEPCFL